MPLWYVTGNELATQTGPADAAENPGNPGIPASSKGTVVAELSASSKGTVVAELSSRQLSGKTRQLPGKTSYAPIKQPCPVAKVPVVREIGANYALSQAEIDFLKLRAPIVKAAWEKYLNNVKVPGLDVGSFVNGSLPIIGMAHSGGGYRAMLNGAGVFAGIDERTPQSINGNQTTGGIVQLLTYLSGLSGGSWLVSSLIANNFDTVQSLQRKVWDLATPIPLPGGDSPAANAVIYRQMISELEQKRDAGFNVTLTDLWGRGLSRHLIRSADYPDYGRAFQYADLANTEPFKSGGTPFFFIEADQQFENRDDNFTNPWEWNPYESGSWATNISAFVPTEFVGTTYNNGTPASKLECVTHFDNYGFAVGTSSAVFNVATSPNNTNNTGLNETESAETEWIRRIPSAPVPNPFKGMASVDANTRPLDNILLADGGNDWQVIPFTGFMVPSRKVDVVIAVDNGGGNNGYPDGAYLIETQRWAKTQNLPFPAVPAEWGTWVSKNLTDRVVFFGCAEGVVSKVGSAPFMIIYQPNRNIVYASNTSTYKLAYNETEANGMIDNGIAQWKGDASKNQGDLPLCVACALTSRAQASMSSVCTDCMQRYCYPSTRFGQAPNPSAITPASTAPVATTTSKPGSAAASKAGMVGTLAAVGLALIASKLLV